MPNFESPPFAHSELPDSHGNWTRFRGSGHFPLEPGTTFVYQGKDEEGFERIEVTVTNDTKRVMGVDCVVLRDRVWIDGKLVEDTFDWHAQDKKGTAWYFGENSREIENGEVVSTEGSCEAGVDGAKTGYPDQSGSEGGRYLPPGVLPGRGHGQGEGAQLGRIGHGALRFLRP